MTTWTDNQERAVVALIVELETGRIDGDTFNSRCFAVLPDDDAIDRIVSLRFFAAVDAADATLSTDPTDETEH